MIKFLNRKIDNRDFDSTKQEITTKKDVNEILESKAADKCNIDNDVKNFIDNLFN